MNQATDRREGNQRGSKSAAALRTWSQNSLHKARSVLSDIGGYLAITEEGARLGEWRERLQRSASRGSIGFSLDDMVSRKDSEDPALTRLEKVLFEEDRPEFSSQREDLRNKDTFPFGRALFTSPELTGKSSASEPGCSLAPPSGHRQNLADERIPIQVCPADGESFDMLHTSKSPHDGTIYTSTVRDHDFVTERKVSPGALFVSGRLGDGSVPRKATTTSQQGGPVHVGTSGPRSILHTDTPILDGPHTTPFYSFYTGAYKLPLKESKELGVASYTRQQQSLRRSREVISPGRRLLRPSSVEAASSPDQKPSSVSFSGEVSVTEFVPARDQSPRSSEEETPVSFLAEEIDDQHPESVSESRHRKYIRRIVRRLKKSPSKSILKAIYPEPWDHLDVSSDDEPSLETTGGSHGHRESPLDTRVRGEEMAVGQTGLKHYKPLQSLEENGQQFLDIGSNNSLRMSLLNRKQTINSALQEAQEKYGKTLSEAETAMFEEQADGKLQDPRGHPYLRAQMDALPTYSPIVILIICIAQMAVFGTFCALGGTADIALEHTVVTANNIHTFLGRESIQRITTPNLWIGPTMRYWISQGATFAPCMRDDYVTNLYLAQQQFDLSVPLGCCELPTQKYGKTLSEAETAMFEEQADGKLQDPRGHPYLRAQMDALPTYSPIVILIICIAQMAVFGTFCALGGTADIALEHTVVTANNIHTFLGRESIQRVTTPNLWIGPTMRYWISE
uniref:Uncharacterized protein n=1 Tax=Branchiostoma floridae TaxID=7739 RepID=C3YJ17_BRAFL|eukprot:XP_002603668.1 hypothetical protein BRAFLDRAFT_128682 [Branchiostoma floridae]